jgi:DNA-binding MarR family transcriptional regulator
LTFHRRANAVFTHFKLTSDQFVLLTALTEVDGVTQKELMRRTNSDPNTVSEMLGRLERRGLVARQRHTADGRAWSVSLTKAGRETQRRAIEGAAPLNVALANLVATDEMETLLGHFERIVGCMSTVEVPLNGSRTPDMLVSKNDAPGGGDDNSPGY